MRVEGKKRPLRILIGLLLIFWGMTTFAMHRFTYSTSSEVHYENSLSQTEYATNANAYLQDEGIQIPLLLQTDERWATETYGVDNGKTIAENGCAPTSLAMILAYYENREVSPTEITNWAKDQYYQADAGTDWSIFPAFAKEYNLTLHDLSADFSKSQTYLEQDIPVVVSALPGEFTDNGHIMVLARYQADTDNLTILDPSDNPEKNHTYSWFTASDYTTQFRHYWAFTKDTSL